MMTTYVVILMLYGPPGGGGWIFTHQRPSGPVTVLAAWPAISTRTASPGSDHPQIVFGFPRCRTMLSPNIGLTNGSGPLPLAAAAASSAPNVMLRR